jgi:hypothetical protein
MPISNSYPKGIPVEDQDLFVGTKAYNNRTVNYSAQSVADYLNINSKVAIGGQMSFQFTIVPNIPKTIAFEGGFGNNTAFSAITKLIVSAIDLSTANITIFLNYLNNSQVLLSEQNQPNFFGHYKITGYTQVGTSAFYELDLEFIGGNGTIIDKQYYDLVSFVLSTEVPPTEWGSITGDIEDQTDLVNYVANELTPYFLTPTGTILEYVRGDGSLATFPDTAIPTWQETLDVDFGVSNIVTTPFYYDDGIVRNSNDIFGLRTEQLTGDLLYSSVIPGQIAVTGGIIGKSVTIDYDFGIQFYKVISSFAKSTYIKADDVINNDVIFQLPNKVTGTYTLATTDDVPAAVTSVGLTMPSAFTVTNSPITSSGDIAVTGAGLVSQYVRGDGTLANFPNSTGGGSSVNYYLNGSVSQGTFGGDTYYQMSKTPILGAGTNFTRTNGAGNGYIASFITDAGDPSFLNIPGGNWNLEFYFNASSGGGSPSFYAELYKVSATNVFTLIASDSLNPEGITNGTTVDQYFTSIPVPQTTLLVTDRLAVRIYVITSGRTITLHTENGNLCEVLTTFTTGLTALNGLTDQVQFFDVGTGATNFNISSSGDTHTFNLLFNIRRNANNSSNNNINYNGYAVTGSAESSAVWTITRLTISASGSITVATATNVAWTDRETTIYT